MKRNLGKYKEVNILPVNALTVAEYATVRNITVGHVYTHYSRGRANYDIVIFKTHNYIIPVLETINTL